MRFKSRTSQVLVSLVLLVCICGAVAAHLRQDHLGKPFGKALTLEPGGPVRGVALVFDDQARSGTPGDTVAHALAERGLLVAVLPAQDYLTHLGQGRCAMAASDAERVGRRLMRWGGVQRYFEPVLVGMGEAGTTLVALAVGNALPQTVAGAVLAHAPDGARQAGACAWRTPSPEQGFVRQAPADGAGIVEAVMANLPKPQSSFRDLPLIELPAAGSHRLVIFMSGDGGWRWLDKGVSADLRAQGISVVGWDSLRYFWSRRTPERAAADLAAVIDQYSQRWHADQVELVGYSFGADAMPFLYNRLPADTRAKVDSLSLLGLGHGASFKVSVGGWLGTSSSDERPVAPELALVPPGKVLCVFGQAEKDTLCPSLAKRAIAVAQTRGGHHFDGDLHAMVQRLEGNFQRNAPAAGGLGAPRT